MVTRKPIPEPLYPCKFCYEEFSWHAGDLFWSERDQSWVCANCWSWEEVVGISLADEIKAQQDQRDWVRS